MHEHYFRKIPTAIIIKLKASNEAHCMKLIFEEILGIKYLFCRYHTLKPNAFTRHQDGWQ